MDSATALLALETPEAFPAFPYAAPYSIQFDLMRHLFDTYESGSVSLVESPTGTGKSLSLLTSALTWLKQHKERATNGQLNSLYNSASSEPAWVIEQTIARQKRLLEAEEQAFTERLAQARKREEIIRRKEKGRVTKKAKVAQTVEIREDEFLPYDQDDDFELLENLSPEVREQLRVFQGKKRYADEEDVQDPICTKIYFASRTHSQLTQAISELRKIEGGSATRTVPLGSRKAMCINDQLRAQPGDLDEGCRELNTRPKEHRCPFLPGADEQSKLLDFRDHTLATPKDIEDLVELGRELKTCPYYGSRKAINRAEVVTLPYNLLLQKNAREALGIDLKDQIVIIDEAHNLIDTVLSIHSHTLSSATLRTSLSQLKMYYTKFRTRFTPKHALHLKRLVIFISALDALCQTWAKLPSEGNASSSDNTNGKKAGQGQDMMTVGELVAQLGAKSDGFNLLEVVAYLKESKIARKISSFIDHELSKAQAQTTSFSSSSHSSKERRRQSPPLHSVEAFLLILVDANKQGRIFVEKTPLSNTNATTGGGDDNTVLVTLKYQLLDPEMPFREIIEEARAIVLAGGTMTPMSDFEQQLFRWMTPGRLKTFSCGHVIPPGNLQTLILTQGPKKKDLLFKFDRRGDRELMIELGQMIINIANITPRGLVVFFPSYAFLDQARKVWGEGSNTPSASTSTSNAPSNSILSRLATKKKLFEEPKDASEVDKVLREYSATVAHANSSTSGGAEGSSPRGGALLFAVVGAKLSEGLNFSDDLARAVVVVGLPFANLGSRELQERMRFVKERNKEVEGQSGTINGRDVGVEMYENLCMKAVNQSIGRAIRHQNDWASLILIDQRYSTPRLRAKLPGWIGSQTVVAKTWGEGLKELAGFFRGKREMVS